MLTARQYRAISRHSLLRTSGCLDHEPVTRRLPEMPELNGITLIVEEVRNPVSGELSFRVHSTFQEEK